MSKKKKKNIHKPYHWILYSLSIVLSIIAVYILSIPNLTLGLISLSLSLGIETYLVFKDIDCVSSTAFITSIVLSIFLYLSTAEGLTNTVSEGFREEMYMLILFISEVFLFINSISWCITKNGWKKTISIILLILLVLITFIFSLTAPSYYENFIFTRPFALIFFVLGIFLIIKLKKFRKIFGILTIALSIGIIYLSTLFFASVVYTVSDNEKEEISQNMYSKVEDILDYYNDGDYYSFAEYFSESLTEEYQNEIGSIANWKDVYGNYTEVGNIEVRRISGMYYVEYPVKFENSSEQFYLILELSSTDSDIYGLYFSSTVY